MEMGDQSVKPMQEKFGNLQKRGSLAHFAFEIPQNMANRGKRGLKTPWVDKPIMEPCRKDRVGIKDVYNYWGDQKASDAQNIAASS